MKMLKNLMVVLVCVSFSMSVGCGSDDPDKNKNTNADGGHSNVDGGNGNVDGGNGNVDGGNGNGNPLITFEAYYEEIAELQVHDLCNKIFNCPQHINMIGLDRYSRFETEAACVSGSLPSIAESKGIFLPGFLDSIESGRSVYDSKKAVACLAMVKEITENVCSTGSADGIDICFYDAFVPALEVGAACTLDFECVNGTCDRGEGNTCSGTCVASPAPAKRDETCHPTRNRCEAELRCKYNQGNSNYTCVDDLRVYGDKDAACDESDDKLCKPGLVCNQDSVCAEPVFGDVGDVCGGQSRCKPGLFCGEDVTGSGGSEEICQAFGKQGDACTYYLNCAAGFYCDDNDKCQVLGDLKQGEDCSELEEVATTHCGSGLFCVFDDVANKGTCETEPAKSEICKI